MDHPFVAHLTPTLPPVLADVRVLPPTGLNTSVYLALNRFSRHTAWAHGFMHAYALWLGPVLLAAVFVAVYAVAWWRRAPRAAALLLLGGIGTVVALGLNQVVNHAVKELRPYAAHPHALVLVAKTSDYSFPSDHSVVAGGLTLAVLLVLSRQAWRRRSGSAQNRGEVIASPRPISPRMASEGTAPRRTVPGVVAAYVAGNVILGLFLCFARVYVGAHYPGDVVAGYLLAGLVVAIISLIRPFAFRAVDHVEPTMLATVLRRPARVVAPGATVSEPVDHPTLGAENRHGLP